MSKANLTVAACVALLWAGPVAAVSPDLLSCTADLSACTANLSACTGSLSTCNTTLTSTQGQLTTCTSDLGTCNTDASVCAANLTSCQEQLTAASAKPRFIDNGDGTVTDTKTGLMWEKKTKDFSVHYEAKNFTWSSSGTDFDGTVKTEFLDVLNDVAGGGVHCFAGYCDWRLPSEEGQNTAGGPKEWETILDYTQGFCGGTGFGSPCLVPALEPVITTAPFGYWSATTRADNTNFAYFVNPATGLVSSARKSESTAARAVRGGF